jgi:HPt (histidine-containing phosphotransfer) domain-containing protein
LQIALRRRRQLEGQSGSSELGQLRSGPSSASGLATPPSLDPGVLKSLQKLQTPKRPDFCARLVRQYRADASQVVGTMMAACERGEGEALRALAHRFKGSSRVIGALRLGFLCEEVETAAKAVDLPMARGAILELEEELSRVVAALSELESQSPPKTNDVVGNAS